jgi:hypothetical protein
VEAPLHWVDLTNVRTRFITKHHTDNLELAAVFFDGLSCLEFPDDILFALRQLTKLVRNVADDMKRAESKLKRSRLGHGQKCVVAITEDGYVSELVPGFFHTVEEPRVAVDIFGRHEAEGYRDVLKVPVTADEMNLNT